LPARPRVLATGGLLAEAALSLTLSRYRIAVCRGRDVLLPCPENVMPRRKSLLAQMYESRQKAKLQQKKLEEQAARAWAAEDRRIAAQAERRPLSCAGRRNALPRPGSGRSSRPSAPGSRLRRRRSGWPPSSSRSRRAGQGSPGHRRSGDQRGYQEERTGRRLQERGPPMAAQGRAGSDLAGADGSSSPFKYFCTSSSAPARGTFPVPGFATRKALARRAVA